MVFSFSHLDWKIFYLITEFQLFIFVRVKKLNYFSGFNFLIFILLLIMTSLNLFVQKLANQTKINITYQSY